MWTFVWPPRLENAPSHAVDLRAGWCLGAIWGTFSRFAVVAKARLRGLRFGWFEASVCSKPSGGQGHPPLR